MAAGQVFDVFTAPADIWPEVHWTSWSSVSDQLATERDKYDLHLTGVSCSGWHGF
jgi:hypothetical protein